MFSTYKEFKQRNDSLSKCTDLLPSRIDGISLTRNCVNLCGKVYNIDDFLATVETGKGYVINPSLMLRYFEKLNTSYRELCTLRVNYFRGCSQGLIATPTTYVSNKLVSFLTVAYSSIRSCIDSEVFLSKFGVSGICTDFVLSDDTYTKRVIRAVKNNTNNDLYEYIKSLKSPELTESKCANKIKEIFSNCDRMGIPKHSVAIDLIMYIYSPASNDIIKYTVSYNRNKDITVRLQYIESNKDTTGITRRFMFTDISDDLDFERDYKQWLCTSLYDMVSTKKLINSV